MTDCVYVEVTYMYKYLEREREGSIKHLSRLTRPTVNLSALISVLGLYLLQ